MTARTPYFRRRRRTPVRTTRDFSSAGDHVDLAKIHLASYDPDDVLTRARALFDSRAAAAVSAGVATAGTNGDGPVRIWPPVNTWGNRPSGPFFWARDLLELKWYAKLAPAVYLPTAKCLPALTYLDFFDDQRRVGTGLWSMVSAAVLAAGPGWCGSFGPGVDGLVDVVGDPSEGNYDMTQMHLLPMAYSFYRELSAQARDHLIVELLARGRIHRPNLDDTFTSGSPPDDWDRAGYISPLGNKVNIGETENHILMIATARYLTNQLLYQRDQDPSHDNRRNAADGGQSCLTVLLVQLRNMLRGDFSEYNSKPYQVETRWALLNLSTYAYDHEVRLAARMVLDYLSARMAVTSNDLRRMLPFRRRNEGAYVKHDKAGFMQVGLLQPGDPGGGADPMAPYFAMQAGNTRAYEAPHPAKPWKWAIQDRGTGLAIEVLSDYRLPESVHDLFVNDLHRRFFQRLHRVPRGGEMGGNRNSDNMELVAGSPSYLITAGGSPSGYAIDPGPAGTLKPEGQRKQLGVAVTTSFMPTGSVAGLAPENETSSLIQFSSFAEIGHSIVAATPGVSLDDNPARNYGVAPDFACGHQMSLPSWAVATSVPSAEGHGFDFVNHGPMPGATAGPGFFLAIHQEAGLACVEALDTWLHPEVSFVAFAESVVQRNPNLSLKENEPFTYRTWTGTSFNAVIWSKVHTDGWERHSAFGAETWGFTYGSVHAEDALGDAGNDTERFLSGTVLNSPVDAVVNITNPALGSTLVLDMSDPMRPRRTSENGEVEASGDNREVWLDLRWKGRSEGDVCLPFASLGAAVDAVAEGGSIRIVPGATADRMTLGAGKKRFRLVAPSGGVVIGAEDAGQAIVPDDELTYDAVRGDDVWVQFDTPEVTVRGPFRTMTDAVAAVRDGGVVRVVPGVTGDRPTVVAGGKRFSIVAPIGGVVIGRGIWA